MLAALGLPVNDLYRSILLLLTTVAVLVGSLSRDHLVWLAAAAVAALTIFGRTVFPAPLIEEGHNVFIVDGPGGALERELPAGPYRLMAAEFNAAHPPERRCDAQSFGC